MDKKGRLHYLTDGIIKENPVLVLILGTCPTLATTSSALNGIGMGVSTTAVLILSNMVISAIRNIVPDKVRIPCYIVVISGFVTVVQLLMQAYTPALYSALGLYIPLIVVNCIILGRAEMFANKHNVFDSMLDGIGMGIGFTFTLVIMGSVREILGSGTWFGLQIIPKSVPGMSIFTLASGGFFVYGCVMAAVNYFTRDKSKIRKEVGETDLFQEAQDLKKKEA
ncbi:MAG: electron transport complex subunit E [Clostridiales bacterium]|jgi:electron transport complex protein RnfE|nr:electron transport complex subunit E [Clostridiales bacterium]